MHPESPALTTNDLDERSPLTAGLVAATEVRRSRRRYDGSPAEPSALEHLRATAQGFRPYQDARIEVLAEAPEGLFTGLIGSYGKITGAVSAALFIGAGEATNRDVHVGFTSEAFVLDATLIGVDTCWIGGAFDRKFAQKLPCINEGERVLAITPLGAATAELPAGERLMRRFSNADRRKKLDEIAPGAASWPAWARRAVEVARNAPSAMNRQPWRFAFEDGALQVRQTGFDTPGVTLRLDIGIAMLHATLGALEEGVPGTWHDEDGDIVARFDAEARG